jgi:hypothetical protein
MNGTWRNIVVTALLAACAVLALRIALPYLETDPNLPPPPPAASQ